MEEIITLRDRMKPHLVYIKWGSAAFGIVGSLIIALNIPISGWAFVIFTVSSVGWMFAAHLMKERSILTESAVYTVINMIGIYRWLF